MSNRNYEELFEAYIEKFGEAFPSFMAPDDPEEAMDIMEECLKSGEPYNPLEDPDFDPDADY